MKLAFQHSNSYLCGVKMVLSFPTSHKGATFYGILDLVAMSSCPPTFTLSFYLYCEGDLGNKKELDWVIATYGCVCSRAGSPGMRAPRAMLWDATNVTFPADTVGKLPPACCSSEETPVNARYLLPSAHRAEVLMSTESERLWAFF